jgi:hypothetical protein
MSYYYLHVKFPLLISLFSVCRRQEWMRKNNKKRLLPSKGRSLSQYHMFFPPERDGDVFLNTRNFYTVLCSSHRVLYFPPERDGDSDYCDFFFALVPCRFSGNAGMLGIASDWYCSMTCGGGGNIHREASHVFVVHSAF